jgi:hypothetical protein
MISSEGGKLLGGMSREFNRGIGSMWTIGERIPWGTYLTATTPFRRIGEVLDCSAHPTWGRRDRTVQVLGLTIEIIGHGGER